MRKLLTIIAVCALLFTGMTAVVSSQAAPADAAGERVVCKKVKYVNKKGKTKRRIECPTGPRPLQISGVNPVVGSHFLWCYPNSEPAGVGDTIVGPADIDSGFSRTEWPQLAAVIDPGGTSRIVKYPNWVGNFLRPAHNPNLVGNFQGSTTAVNGLNVYGSFPATGTTDVTSTAQATTDVVSDATAQTSVSIQNGGVHSHDINTEHDEGGTDSVTVGDGGEDDTKSTENGGNHSHSATAQTNVQVTSEATTDVDVTSTAVTEVVVNGEVNIASDDAETAPNHVWCGVYFYGRK